MNKRKVGRNDPCPCGSGRKYKKCCFGKPLSSHSLKKAAKEPKLPPHERIDYGTPLLDEAFFNTHHLREFSPHRLIYSGLLQPELEKAVSMISNQHIVRGKNERKKIDKTTDVAELMDIMRRGPDTLNHISLREKLLQDKKRALPLILQELTKPQCDAFVELAVKILHEAGDDYSAEIMEIIAGSQREAYTLSLLCMLLGFYESEGMEKLLWDYFHYFTEHYNNESYGDGPFLGLHEMMARRKEKSELSASGSIPDSRGRDEKEEPGRIC